MVTTPPDKPSSPSAVVRSRRPVFRILREMRGTAPGTPVVMKLRRLGGRVAVATVGETI